MWGAHRRGRLPLPPTGAGGTEMGESAAGRRVLSGPPHKAGEWQHVGCNSPLGSRSDWAGGAGRGGDEPPAAAPAPRPWEVEIS